MTLFIGRCTAAVAGVGVGGMWGKEGRRGQKKEHNGARTRVGNRSGSKPNCQRFKVQLSNVAVFQVFWRKNAVRKIGGQLLPMPMK